MKNNLLYFRGRLNSKISRSLAQCLEKWLGYGFRDGDIIQRIYPSNPTIAKTAKISTRTVLRAKNEAEALGIIERYYDPIAQKECLRIFLRVLATFLDARGIKYLPKIFPNDTLELKQPEIDLVNESATLLSVNDIKQVNESATQCRGSVNESATPCRTISPNKENIIIKKEEDFIFKIKDACEESVSVHPSDGAKIQFTEQLVRDVQAFVASPPEWISSEGHARNHVLKQIRTGQYKQAPKRIASPFIEDLPKHAVPEVVARTPERAKIVNYYFKQMFSDLSGQAAC